MIITQEKNKQVVQSHDFDAVDCTIDAEDMRYVASLLRNNYSNPTLAVVREITANALDANSEAGQTRPIEVTIPSRMNPHFLVRDFGGGLSQEDVFGLYSKYGKSTKRNTAVSGRLPNDRLRGLHSRDKLPIVVRRVDAACWFVQK